MTDAPEVVAFAVAELADLAEPFTARTRKYQVVPETPAEGGAPDASLLTAH